MPHHIQLHLMGNKARTSKANDRKAVTQKSRSGVLGKPDSSAAWLQHWRYSRDFPQRLFVDLRSGNEFLGDDGAWCLYSWCRLGWVDAIAASSSSEDSRQGGCTEVLGQLRRFLGANEGWGISIALLRFDFVWHRRWVFAKTLGLLLKCLGYFYRLKK